MIKNEFTLKVQLRVYLCVRMRTRRGVKLGEGGGEFEVCAFLKRGGNATYL